MIDSKSPQIQGTYESKVSSVPELRSAEIAVRRVSKSQYFPYRQENLELVFSFINFSIIIQKTFLLTQFWCVFLREIVKKVWVGGQGEKSSSRGYLHIIISRGFFLPLTQLLVDKNHFISVGIFLCHNEINQEVKKRQERNAFSFFAKKIFRPYQKRRELRKMF